MVIAHNMAAANTQRQYNINTGSRAKNTEKLSSGYKINRAADDAAGLTISEKMRSQIRGLTQASNNSQDGISFVQIADGALAEVQDMLDRMTELTVKAANGTNTEADRAAIQKEIAELTSEIDRVHESTEFNTIDIFIDKGHNPGETDVDMAPVIDTPNGFSIGNIDVTFSFVGADGVTTSGSISSVGDTNNYPAAFTDFVKNASKNAASNLSTLFPNLFKASSADIQIGLNADTTDGAGKVLASAWLSMSSSAGTTGMTYAMNIDKTDYNPTTFDPTNPASRDLAATIAHEMTHIVMYDTLTTKMIGNNEFPSWLIEGMAQTASGDNGWVSNHINPSSSEADVKDYMSKVGSMPYGAGYLATMELGLEVARIQSGNPSLPATSANIASGLDTFLGEMVNQEKGLGTYAGSPQGIDVDEAIKNVTNGKYNNLADYYNKFKTASPDLLNGVNDILAARGTTGAGSLFDNLNKSEADVFDPSNYKTSSNNYAIDTDHKTVQNKYGAGVIPAAPSSMGGGGSGLGEGDIILQVGAQAGQEIAVKRFNMTAQSIFDYETVDCSTQNLAKSSIQTVVDAKARVSNVRSYYGAVQNRLEHTIKNLDNVVENTQAAESQIRDTDMAKEMVEYTKNNILLQAGEAMMAQANQSTQGVLSLLQ